MMAYSSDLATMHLLMDIVKEEYRCELTGIPHVSMELSLHPEKLRSLRDLHMIGIDEGIILSLKNLYTCHCFRTLTVKKYT